MSLSGTHIYNLDRKGRLVCPAAFRAELGAPFILTRAPAGCLLALSLPQWKVLCARYERSLPFRGYYLASASECHLDPHTGRFLIPHVLREYAGLRPMQEIALSGVGRAVQIAARARWEEHLRTGEFPSLGQLDLDVDVPRAVECGAYRQRVGRPLGLPVVECRGRMHGRAVRRLSATVLRLVEDRPDAIVLDVRDTGETAQALSAVQELTRELRGAVPLWLVSDRALETQPGVSVFRDLEAVLWQAEAAGIGA